MLTIPKGSEADITELKSKLDSHAAEIQDELAAVNTKIGDLNEKIQRYNNILKNARDLRDGIVASMHDYIEEQPEGWTDGDKGTAYNDWLEGWEDADLEFIRQAEEIEVDEQDHSETLGDLPLEP